MSGEWTKTVEALRAFSRTMASCYCPRPQGHVGESCKWCGREVLVERIARIEGHNA